MGPHLLFAFARPYRPRQPWQDDLDLAFAAFVVVSLIVSAIAWIIDHRRKAKADKHAALNRILAKQRRQRSGKGDVTHG